MRPGIAVLVVSLLLAAPAPVAAQDDRATFDSTGNALLWGVGTFELTLVATAVIVAGSECQTWGCGIMALLGATTGFLISVVTAVIAGLTDAPSDVPFVWHTGLWPGLGVFALTAGLKEEIDPGADEPVLLVLPATAVALGGWAWAFVRREEMLRDPDLLAATHLITWVPFTLGLLTAYIVSELEVDGPLVPIVGALMGLTAFGLGVALVETQRD